MGRVTGRDCAEAALGAASGLALAVVLVAAFAGSYLENLGGASPVLWDGYALWLGALAAGFFLSHRASRRAPVFAGAMHAATCAASVLLLVALWLLDNGVGFSA